jgi:hypothetical protein
MRTYHKWIVASLLSITLIQGYAGEPRYDRKEVSPEEYKDLQKGRESSDPQPLVHERAFTAENPPPRSFPEPQPIKPSDIPPRQRPMPSPTPDITGGPIQSDPERGVTNGR